MLSSMSTPNAGQPVGHASLHAIDYDLMDFSSKFRRASHFHTIMLNLYGEAFLVFIGLTTPEPYFWFIRP